MEGTGMLDGKPGQQEGDKLWQYLSALSANMLAIGVGTALGWTAPMQQILTTPYPERSWTMTTEDYSWVCSALALGSMMGALPAGAIANSIGRKRALLFLAVPFILSWLIILFGTEIWMVIAARFLIGLAVGGSCVLVPTYLSEIGETSIRGTLGAMFQLFLTVGIVFVFIVGALLEYKAVAFACVLIEILFVITFIFMPESPVWLVGKGRKAEAASSLRRLRGDVYDTVSELAMLQKEADENSTKKSSVFDLVRLPAPRKALFICFAGMMFQQLSGINAVIMNTNQIFQDAGSSMSPDLASILVAGVQCIMAVVAAGVVDKAGRKPLLIFSSTMMAVSLVAIGLFFKLQETKSDLAQNLTWLPLVSLIVFMIAFSVGMGPIPWMLMGELFTVELKGNASSLAVMLNWFLVFLVTKTFPTMKDVFNLSGSFWIFAIIMASATVFTFTVVPETKGKSVQEIQGELSGRRNRSI